MQFRGRGLRAEIVPDAATYSLLSGDPLTVHHYGTEAHVNGDESLTLPIPAPERRPAPEQPPHRRPRSAARREQDEG